MKIAKLLNVTIEEQASALTALFYLFKEKNYEPVHEDLKLEIAPTVDDENAYVCCEQKIIHWGGAEFLISCLYDSHPTFQFATKEEVVSFYEGYFSTSPVFLKEKNNAVDNAFNSGVAVYYYEILGERTDVGKNVAKAISEIQVQILSPEQKV